MVDLWSQVLKQIEPHPGLGLKSDTHLGWAIRKDNPQLKSWPAVSSRRGNASAAR